LSFDYHSAMPPKENEPPTPDISPRRVGVLRTLAKEPWPVRRVRRTFRTIKRHWLISVLGAGSVAFLGFGNHIDAWSNIRGWLDSDGQSQSLPMVSGESYDTDLSLLRSLLTNRKLKPVREQHVKPGPAERVDVIPSAMWADAEVANKIRGDPYGAGYWIRQVEEPHILILHVRAAFANAQFNLPQHLDSIATITRSGIDERRGSQNELAGFRAVLVTPTDGEGDYVDWDIVAVFSKKPSGDDRLTFATGPVEWTISLSALQWKPLLTKATADFGHSRSLYAQVSTTLNIRDPDWPIFHGARIFRLAHSSRWNVELSIQNLSDVPLPIDNIRLEAGYEWDSGVSCANGEPPDEQDVTLNWELLTSTKGAKGAETTIGSEVVPVPVQLSLGKPCSPSSRFLARVPTRREIPPKGFSRITLKIDESPSGFGLGTLLSRVADETIMPTGRGGYGYYYRGLEVSFPDTRIYPSRRAIPLSDILD
jgi:hypothetical protein